MSHFYNRPYLLFFVQSITSAKNETIFLKGEKMPKPRTENGGKNLISRQLIELRKRDNYSQRDLAYRLQLEGCDMDKNAITRIETDKRYVSDFEIKALSDIFHVSYEYLIDGVSDTQEKRAKD